MRAALGAVLFTAGVLVAAPAWKGPERLPFGELGVLELLEADPSAPPLPRPPVEQNLGSLRVRSVEASADGRGWRLTVQGLQPGRTLLPSLDFGDGRRSPELRLDVPRTAPYEGLWMALGGGAANELPEVPFPWAWASLILAPLLALLAGVLRAWRQGAPGRQRRHLARRFRHAWPPRPTREALDAAHLLGRDLLAAAHGEEARGWGAGLPSRGGVPGGRTPAGELEIDGIGLDRLPHAREAGVAPKGTVRQNLDIGAFAAETKLRLEPLVIEQHSETPDGLSRDWPRPDFGIEKHESYALQWYSFAALAIVLVIVLSMRRAPGA